MDLHTIGRGYVRNMSRRPEISGRRVDAECHDSIGILVGREQEPARGIDAETTWRLSLSRLVIDIGQSSGALIDPVYRYAVVTSIRSVDEHARRRDLDIGAGAVATKPLGKGGDNLQLFECPGLAVECHGCHRGVELIDEIGKLAPWMESDVAWTGARFHLDPGNTIRFQHSSLRIELVDEQLVQSEIWNERVAVRPIERDRVRMRTILADRIDTRSLMLDEIAGFSEAAVITHRQDADEIG